MKTPAYILVMFVFSSPLRLNVVRSLVYFEHDDRQNECDNVYSGRNPAIDGVLIVQLDDIIICVVLRCPLLLVYWKIFGQRWSTNLEKDSEQCLQIS